MKAISTPRILIFSIIVLLISLACVVPSSLNGILKQAPANATPGAAETLLAEPATKVAAQVITSTSAPKPTATASAYPTLRPSSTPYPTFTPVKALPRLPTCDQSGFVADVTIPDGTNLPGGTQSIKTWKIKNTGACTWTSDYSIVFSKGDSFGYVAERLTRDVEPGETVEVSVTITSPTAAGHYRAYFQMQNKRGKGFLGTFYVDFNVVSFKTPTPDPKVRYEFAVRQCDAAWVTGSKSLSCPGTNGNSDGFMLFVVNPVLESGYVDNEPGLLMNPPTGNNTFIRATYPGYQVVYGDHFRSIVGCERGASKCSVVFELSYIQNGVTTVLGTWTESYNEAYTNLDLDLSGLAGQTVQFVLTVSSNGTSDGDRGLWLRPRIRSALP